MSDRPDTRPEPSPADESQFGHGVKVLLTEVEGADIDAAIAAVRRQVYEPVRELVVVASDPGSVPDGVNVESNLEEAIAAADSDVEYLWILHADARPRPDALGALVAELARSEASLAGSKLLIAGTENELESVGSATDVFGEPFSGLDEGEIDLQQYDVVREVAFVPSASMLVRRDLAQGLRGLDPLLPPVAAGLDFSQRTRLAGGRVVSVPSSEVYHQGRCEAGRHGWREQAGRLRSMVTAYSPLTLLWVLPYDLVVSVLDSIANLLLLRWRPTVRYARSWLWNLLHLPSTLMQRRRFRPVRVAKDEELFRFQSRGSVRLRETGSELTGKLLSVFDDDQALARGTRRVWSSPGIWGAVLGAALVLLSARSILLGIVPNVGFSFPFEEPGVALERWAGGFNEAGLGSNSPVHPAVGLIGAISWLLLGAPGATRTLASIALGLIAVVGLGRLAGRMGLRGPGRYLAGLVLVAGPGTAALSGAGSWTALAAAAVLPWTVRSAFTGRRRGAKASLNSIGWAMLLGVPLAALSPALAVVPLVGALLWRVLGGSGASIYLGVVALVGGVVAIPFLLSDPGWLVDVRRSLGLVPDSFWLALVAAGAVALLVVESSARTVGMFGALLAVSGITAARIAPMGPGLEEAALIVASFGAALLVAGSIDVVSRDLTKVVAVVAGGAILVVSLAAVGNGRLGLPQGDVNSRLSFAETLADGDAPGRILVASATRSDVPGESRPGPGFWYRVVDGSGTTFDEIWLPPEGAQEKAFRGAIDEVARGSLRPGALLDDYSVSWVVLMGEPFSLDLALESQLDLIPTPLDPDARVFENPDALPVPVPGPGEPEQLGFLIAIATGVLIAGGLSMIIVDRTNR